MAKKKKEEEKKIPVGSYTASPSGYAIDKSLPAKSTTSSASSSTSYGTTVDKSLPAKSSKSTKSPISTPRDPTVFRIEVDPKRTVDKSRLFDKNDKGRRTNDPDKITKGGYIARQAYSGLGHGVAGTEGLIRTAAAKELEQARKANSTKSAADTLFENLFGGTRDTLNSIQWEKGAGLGRNLMNVGGGYIDATGQLIQGLSGAEGIKNWLAGRALEEDAAQNGLSVNEQAELEKNALIGNNNVENALRLNQLDRATEAARERMPWAVRAGGDVANVVSSLAPSVAASAITKNPKVGRALMSASAAGNQAMDALDNGADINKALRAGYASGATEYGLEGLFGGIPLLDTGEGLMNKAITAGASKVLPKEALQAVSQFGSTKGGRWLAWAGRKLGEGVEEVASELARPSIEGIYKDRDDIEKVTAKSLATSGGLGIAVALLLGGSPNNIRLGKDVSVEQLALADYALRMQMEEEYRAALERNEQERAAAIARQAEQEAAIFNEMRQNNAALRNLDVGRLVLQLGEESQSPELDTEWLARQEQNWNQRNQPEQPDTQTGLDLMRLGMESEPGYDQTPYMEARANEEAAGGYYRGRDVSLYPENIPSKPTFGLDLINRGLDKQRPVSERLADMQKPTEEQTEKPAPTLSENSILNDVTAEDAAAAQQLVEQNGAEAVAQNLLNGVERQKQMNGTQKYAALLAAEQLEQTDPETAEKLRSAVFSPADNARALIDRNGAEATAVRLLAVIDSGRELNPTQIRAAQILAEELRDTNPELARQMDNASKGIAPIEETEPVGEATEQPKATADTTEGSPLISEDGYPVVDLERRNMGLNVPQGAGEVRERGFSNNTLQKAAEAGTVDREVANAMSGNTYSSVTNAQTRATAVAAIDKYGVERISNYLLSRGATDRSLGDKVMNKGNLSSVEYAAVLELIRRYNNMGLTGRALAMAEIAEAASTDAGRLIQYNKTLMSTDPVMYVTYQTKKARSKGVELSENRKQVLAVIANAVKAAEEGTWNGKLDFSGIKWSKSRGRSNGVGIVANPTPAQIKQDYGLTDKQGERFDRCAEYIAQSADGTNFTEAEWLTALGASCASDAIPSKAESWIGAIRRINLLLNLKTTAIRNGGGNLLQLVLENIADIPSAAIAAMFKGENNPDGMSAVRLGGLEGMPEGFKKGLKTSYLALQTGTLQQLNNRYSDMTEIGTRLGGSYEGPLLPLLNAFRFLDDLTSFSVSVLDTAFSTAREQQVKNQFADIMNDSEYAELTEEMDKIAEEAGQRVTFTNDNPIKTLVTSARNLGRSLQRSSNPSTQVLGDVITTAFQMLMPFAGVTSTILHTGLSYSPVGFISGMVDLVGESAKAGSIKNMSMTDQRRIATKFGRAITGSLLSFAAMFAAAAGAATGREPDDEVESAIWKMEGRNPYSIKFGDNWYDLSALGPAMGLVSVGATVFQEMDGDISKENWWPILKGLMFNSTDIKLNDTLDDNLWESVKKAAQYVGDRDWTGLLQYMLSQITGQFTPFSSLLRAVTYGTDPYVRETSGEDEWGWITNRWKSGIPGLSQTLPESMDITGQPRERYPNADTDLKRWANALFNPAAKISEDRSDDPVVQELARLARETGDEKLPLSTAPYKLAAGGKEKYTLFGEERSAYQQTRGTELNEYLSELFNTDDYKALPTEEQHKMVNNILDLTEYDAKQTVADTGHEYIVPDSAKGSKLSTSIKEAGEHGIDLPSYLLYSMDMNKDYTLVYESEDQIPIIKSGKNKGKPKASVGEPIDSGKKKGAALAIMNRFGDELDADQMYYLWTLQSPSGKSAWVEVRDGGTDNDYYRYFVNKWSEDELRAL